MSDVATDLTTSNGLAEHLNDVQVVDCREPYEWKAGRIEGSIHIPLNTILAGATGQLDPEKTTVVVCRSGNRSELATLMLRARGFEAYNLEHGLEEWADQGRPLTTPDGATGHVA
jgi:rhodanese-related sulfurtransferase